MLFKKNILARKKKKKTNKKKEYCNTPGKMWDIRKTERLIKRLTQEGRENEKPTST